MNDLIITQVVDNLDAVNRKNVLDTFAPIVIKLNEKGKSFKTIQQLETSPEKSVLSKRFRIDFGKILTSADNARKGLKEESIKTGKGIQAVYKYIIEATSEIKNEAINIEKHYERIEEEKKAKLQLDRQVELETYDADGEFVDLGNMPNEVWINYLAGVKNNFEAIKEAERKAESDRIEAVKKETEKQEHIILENKRLRVEAEKERKRRATEQKKLEKEKALQEDKLQLEREKVEAEKRIQDDIIRQEREAKEKLEKEIADKEAERLRLEKEESDKLKAEQKKAKNAPDKEKLSALIIVMMETRTLIKEMSIKNYLHVLISDMETYTEGL